MPHRTTRKSRLAPLALAAALLCAGVGTASAQTPAPLDPALLARALDRAAGMTRLRALIVARDGKTLVARAFRGPGLDTPVNIKSASKSIISALVGAAIARGVLRDADQRIAPLLNGQLPRRPDPRLRRLTIGHLLSMRAGLERTSGRNYGRWVASADWVRFALSRPFVDRPGGRMLYSTGNTHLISAILTRRTGRSTLALARDWLAAPLGIALPPWQRDPQGIYFGGNNMKLAPRALLRFGEMVRNGGVHVYRRDGVRKTRRVLPEDWVRQSWTPRTRSRYSGDFYGYGWFITGVCGRKMVYARGFGGQMLTIVPSLALTIVITSDPTIRTRRDGYRTALRTLVAGDLVRAAERAGGGAARDYAAVEAAGRAVPEDPDDPGPERSFGAVGCGV